MPNMVLLKIQLTRRNLTDLGANFGNILSDYSSFSFESFKFMLAYEHLSKNKNCQSKNNFISFSFFLLVFLYKMREIGR